MIDNKEHAFRFTHSTLAILFRLLSIKLFGRYVVLILATVRSAFFFVFLSPIFIPGLIIFAPFSRTGFSFSLFRW